MKMHRLRNVKGGENREFVSIVPVHCQIEERPMSMYVEYPFKPQCGVTGLNPVKDLGIIYWGATPDRLFVWGCWSWLPYTSVSYPVCQHPGRRGNLVGHRW